ncbi:MAG: aspartate carbamoyltransferase [Candidatus Zipacnadales bacterium]
MPSLVGRSLVSVDELTGCEIAGLLKLAEQMAEAIGFGGSSGPTTPVAPLDRILAALFFEPSTRTRLSFEAAMLRLGGQTLGFAESTSCAAAKGECLADTLRIVSGYADVIVIRHPLEGAARLAARAATVPVINGGDGAHLHPTQTLTDLFLLQRRLGRLEGLRVGLLGDLRHGRTVHSLAPTLARLGTDVICIAPDPLQMPRLVLRRIAEATGTEPLQVRDVREVLSSLDALYVTRIQRERFEDPGAYEDVTGAYRIDASLLAQAPESMLLMHPLPRVDELDPAVDSDPRAVYFEQAEGGVPVRMALIAALLGLHPLPKAEVNERPLKPLEAVTSVTGHCRAESCVIAHEPHVPPEFVTFAGETVCAYCERPIRP